MAIGRKASQEISFDRAILGHSADRPTTVVATSLDIGWTSALVEVQRAPSRTDAFETSPTSDQTIVGNWQGAHHLECFSGGRWRRATYREGSIGMTPGGETARLRWTSDPSPIPIETVHLYMPQAVLVEAAEEYRRVAAPLPEVPLSVLRYDDSVVFAALSALIDAMSKGAPDLYAAATMRWLAAHLLFRHSRGFAAQDDGRDGGVISEPRLARVIEYMRSRWSETLSLDRLASEAGVSKFHFSRLFRNQTGETPHGYLIRLRLEAARDLLQQTNRRIDDIAASCGYRRAAHFSAAFSRRFGESPRSFRHHSCLQD